jgi:hypothetical protein
MYYLIEVIADAINDWLGFVHLDKVTSYQIGWAATFICILIPWLLARTDPLKKHGRLYTATALLACTWLLVLATYIAPGDIQTPRERQAVGLASDVAAVLLVYIGGLIASSAQGQQGGTDVAQRAAQSLLIFVAVPPAIDLLAWLGQLGPILAKLFGVPNINSRQTADVVSLILVIAGFYSVGRGAHYICGTRWPRLGSAITYILIFYAVPQVLRTIHIFPSQPSDVSMPKYQANVQLFVLWNALAKVLLTSALSLAFYKEAEANPAAIGTSGPGIGSVPPAVLPQGGPVTGAYPP